MDMWDSIPVKNLIVPAIHPPIGLRNYILRNILGFVDSDVEKLSKCEEVSHSTLVTVNQVIAKRQQDRQIQDFNDDVMLQRKYMQLNQLQDMKESTPGVNNNIGITIAPTEKNMKKKKGKNWQMRSPNY